jgi:hypothetical protein
VDKESFILWLFTCYLSWDGRFYSRHLRPGDQNQKLWEALLRSGHDQQMQKMWYTGRNNLTCNSWVLVIIRICVPQQTQPTGKNNSPKECLKV